MRSKINGRAGWVCIGLFAAWVDFSCPQGRTLSEDFDAFRRQHPYLAYAWLALTVAHLTRAWDAVGLKRLDPYGGFGLRREAREGDLERVTRVARGEIAKIFGRSR